MRSQNILLVISSIVLFISTANALRCYQCSSLYDMQCRKHPTQTIINCQPDYSSGRGLDARSCATLVLQNPFNASDIRVERGCYYGQPGTEHTFSGKGCNLIDQRYSTQVRCTTCSSDLCNSDSGALSIMPMISMILFIAISILSLSKIMY